MTRSARSHRSSRAWLLGVGLVAAGCVGRIGDDASSGNGPPGETNQPLCTDRKVSPMPLKRLTRTQYDNAIGDLLQLVASSAVLESLDEKVGPFDANYKVPVTQVAVDEFASLAEELSDATTLDALAPCTAAAGDAAAQKACAESFVADFGRRAYRRPLDDVERARYLAVFDENLAADGFEPAMRTLIMAFLQSPHFLYHMEMGDGVPDADGLVALPPFALASRLSFFLWNSVPDAELLDAAEAGELAGPDGLRAQAERMITDDKARRTIDAFTVQWLKLDGLMTLQKTPTTAMPDFGDDVRKAMRDEVVAFANHVIRDDDSRFETLMTAPYTLYDELLAGIYGASAPADPSKPLALDPTQRAGVLTLPGWLATQAHPAQTSPVLRGVTVRENVLCQPLQPPPPNVNNAPPEPDPGATTRERFAAHTSEPTCAACHTLIDGIGFGFERYDTFGAFRSEENGLSIDDSGQVVALDEETAKFNGAVELAHLLAESENGRACMEQQWLRFALARPTTEVDTCAFDTIAEKFAASDWSIRQLLVEIVLSDPFRFRPGGEP